MIIVIEGINAAGKKSQTAAVVQAFEGHKDFNEVSTLDFPHYSSQCGSLVSRILKGDILIVPPSEVVHVPAKLKGLKQDISNKLSSLVSHWGEDKSFILQAVMHMDRSQHSTKLREYEGNYSNLIVLDRYYMSGKVYGMADGIPYYVMEQVNSVLPVPDIMFLLDIPVEESFRRRPKREDPSEEMIERLEEVRRNYLNEFRSKDYFVNPRTHYVIIDGLQHPSVITNQIVSYTNHVLNNR